MEPVVDFSSVVDLEAEGVHSEISVKPAPWCGPGSCARPDDPALKAAPLSLARPWFLCPGPGPVGKSSSPRIVSSVGAFVDNRELEKCGSVGYEPK